MYKIDLPDGDYIIRKLTPIEAERLQTLPDNYTEGVSNSQRYKCIGNGWTVDVIAWILGGLKKNEPKLKPCPFCGSKNVYMVRIRGKLIGIVYCPDCGLYCTVDRSNASEEEIADRWNRRVQDD